MKNHEKLLVLAFGFLATGIGITTLIAAPSEQAIVIAALIGAAGLTALVAVMVFGWFDRSQTAMDAAFLAKANDILATSANYRIWQDAIDHLRVIATRAPVSLAQMDNAARATRILDECGEGEQGMRYFLTNG